MEKQNITTDVEGLYMSEILKVLHSFTPSIPLKYDAIRMYSLDKLAPDPLIGGGKGKGNKTVYPLEAPAEIAASYRMIKKYPGYKDEIAGARKIALHIEKSEFNAYSDLRSDEELCLMLRGDEFKALLAGQWLREKLNNIGKVENFQKSSLQIKLKHNEKTELLDLNGKDFLTVQDRRRLLVRVYPVLAMISTWGQSNPMFPVLFNPQ